MNDVNAFRDKYENERIFIIGTGPSLSETPLEKLSNEFTLGVNKIHLIYDQTDWRPSLFVCVGPQEPPKAYKATFDLDIPCFLANSNSKGFEPKENLYTFYDVKIHNTNPYITKDHIEFDKLTDYRGIWSDDISEVIYRYNTVMYPAIQIATYMGFSEIYLVGCDLYEDYRPHMLFSDASDPMEVETGESQINLVIEYIKHSNKPLRSVMNGLAYFTLRSAFLEKIYPYIPSKIMQLEDPSHFTDEYWISPKDGNLHNHRHILNHELIKKISRTRDFSVFNATIGGHLDVYPRVDLEEIV